MEFNIGDKVLLNTKGIGGWEGINWAEEAGIVEGEMLVVKSVGGDSLSLVGKTFAHPKCKFAKLIGGQNERV